MSTQEVPSHEWFTFFAEYTRTHQGQPVTLTVLDASIGAQEETQPLSFVGISTDRDGHAGGAGLAERPPVEIQPVRVRIDLHGHAGRCRFGEHRVEIESIGIAR